MTQLLLVHGINTAAAVWDPVIATLPPGISANAPACPALPTVEAVAQALLAQAPSRFRLAGYSFGGYVALAMLEMAPERIEGLALVCTSTAADGPRQIEARTAAIRRAEANDYAAIAREAILKGLHSSHRDDPALIDRAIGLAEAYGVERFIAHQRACMARPDRSGVLRGFEGPTLVVSGDEDELVALALQQQLLDQAPAADQVRIAPAGHLLPVEQPGELAKALMDWARG